MILFSILIFYLRLVGERVSNLHCCLVFWSVILFFGSIRAMALGGCLGICIARFV